MAEPTDNKQPAWVFNQQMLDAALDAWKAKGYEDSESHGLTRGFDAKRIGDFLTSPDAAKLRVRNDG